MGILKRGARAASQEQDTEAKGSWWRDHRGTPRTRSVVVATGVLAVAITPFALAATGSNLREGLRNGTATAETQIISRVDASTASTGGYSTRQSNLSSSGGGAVYGCRSTAGSSLTNPPKNPCIRANNLADGQAFEFNATSGAQAGSITVGTGGDTKKPFTTNATGVATGLNADRVDGFNADQLVAAAVNQVNSTRPPADSARATRWALVGRDGQIIEQSGGFRVVTAYPGGDSATGNQNVYLDTGASLEGKAVSATIAAQNSTNGTSPAAADQQNFAGEVSAARCQTAITRCVPANTDNVNTLVVSPRGSDGVATTPANRKAFYVEVTA
jgi:hypothetical protein